MSPSTGEQKLIVALLKALRPTIIKSLGDTQTSIDAIVDKARAWASDTMTKATAWAGATLATAKAKVDGLLVAVKAKVDAVVMQIRAKLTAL
jgi:hypothetical protein